MILLVGATGRLGKAVAERLLDDGVPFRAACRSAAGAQWLVERGVEVVHLDLESGRGLPEALAGATRIVACVHGLLGKSRHSIERLDVRGHAALIDAAAGLAVRRFVYISALGASPDHPSEFWRAKARTEQHLKASGLDYVILRPSAFMDLYAHDLIGASVLSGKRVFLLGSGTTARNMIAVADVARAAILALRSDDPSRRTIEIGGHDNPTEREVAALYARLAGVPCRVRSLPLALAKTMAAAIGPFHAGFGRLLRLPGQLAGRADVRLDASAMTQLGIDPVRLHDFVESKVAAAQAGRE